MSTVRPALRSTPFVAAIFDLDGLLVDSERAIQRAWLEAAAEVGATMASEDYLAVVGLAAPAARERLTALLGPARFEAARLVVAARVGPDSGCVFPAKPGAAEALAALGRLGVRLAVASSTALGEVRRRLAAVGLASAFHALAGGDEVDRGKPAPDLFQLAATRLGVLPADSVAFEDSAHGLAAARAAGMAAVAIPDLKALDPASSDRQLGNLGELVALAPEWFSPR